MQAFQDAISATRVGETLGRAHREGIDYGRSEQGFGHMIVIEYSSPMIARPFDAGHIRSTVVGRALYNIFEFLGYESAGINHLDDWSERFGELATAFQQWGDWQELSDRPVARLFDLQSRFDEAVATNPELRHDASAWFRKLDDGDPEARDIWQKFRDLSLADFQRIYADLGIDFDAYTGESFYEPMVDDTLKLLDEKGLCRQRDGDRVIHLGDHGLGTCVLKDASGVTTHLARDLAALMFRAREYRFERMLYAAQSGQSQHFEQLFKIVELLGFDWVKDCHHIAFGTIRFAEGLAANGRNVVFLGDVFDAARRKAAAVVREHSGGSADFDELAYHVGIGAVVFNDLKRRRHEEVSVDTSELIDVEGRTGPYLQYTHARICSILRRNARDVRADVDCSLLAEEDERSLVARIAAFPDCVQLAGQEYEPSIISEYLLDLAEDFRRYDGDFEILLDDDEKLRDARVLLTETVGLVLRNGLKLLGLQAPTQM